MIRTLAVSGYRSLRDLVLPLEQLTVVTGANGTGKTSLYRSLRLLGETAQGRLVASLAAEGGLTSVLWAGPERIGRGVREGRYRVEGTVRKGPVSLRLGFGDEHAGYALDLGMPSAENPFPLDPAIKREAMWTGGRLSHASIFADRRGGLVRLRDAADGTWREAARDLSPFDSMITHCADPLHGAELLLLRERLRDWRFYDALRTDPQAPARRPQVMTYTPVLASDGSDLSAAIATIRAIGDEDALEQAVDDAFPGSRLSIEPGENGGLALRQHGLLRPLRPAELSDGTLRFLLLCAALLSPRPPGLMVLNEPEASLHPDLMQPLARLLWQASRACRIVVVSHSAALIAALGREGEAGEIRLEKRFGETVAPDVDPPRWEWPKR
ncbi:AAA family ATPase [Aureimonas jatrophae]|uniref:Predicted ATPase n=1 Tax=Aureimonas jatrophae TaxID=1166073 RepID=A0A1H0C6E2_9HYPH|nr:AAA family ATPase [Aureimonas jatrophae]MBB3949087.1 putative ATPase [Aureimonas jatrophae]SDN53421.1 Predicted ATPase [Aureimonas jatrophae]